MSLFLHTFFIGHESGFAGGLKADRRGTKAVADICKDLAKAKDDRDKTVNSLAQAGGHEVVALGTTARKRALADKARAAMTEKNRQKGQKRQFSLTARARGKCELCARARLRRRIAGYAAAQSPSATHR